MANIMINKVCNLNCPYCFANKYVNKASVDDENNISIDNFKTALSFVTKTDNSLGIIGGEPLLHPDFKNLLDIAINNDKIQKILVFTNGIYIDNFIDVLSNDKVKLLININSPKVVGEKIFEKTISNMKVLFEKSSNDKNKISIGINMYKELEDYNYIFKVIDKFSFRGLRMSITVPNTEEKENQSPECYFNSMKEIVLDFFKECDKHNVVPYYDCNFMPPCVYSPEEFKWISNFLEKHKDSGECLNLLCLPHCAPVIDILPNLNAIRCFGFSNMEVPIRETNNLIDIGNFFIKEIDNYSDNIVIDNKCGNCYDLNTRKCSSGCLAFKHKKIDSLRKITKIFNENI